MYAAFLQKSYGINTLEWRTTFHELCDVVGALAEPVIQIKKSIFLLRPFVFCRFSASCNIQKIDPVTRVIQEVFPLQFFEIL